MRAGWLAVTTDPAAIDYRLAADRDPPEPHKHLGPNPGAISDHDGLISIRHFRLVKIMVARAKKYPL